MGEGMGTRTGAFLGHPRGVQPPKRGLAGKNLGWLERTPPSPGGGDPPKKTRNFFDFKKLLFKIFGALRRGLDLSVRTLFPAGPPGGGGGRLAKKAAGWQNSAGWLDPPGVGVRFP
jgi:hypothetical protein